MSWTAEWNEVVDGLPDDGYNAWVMTPMFKSNMTTLDFLWVGAWPTYTEMGSGLDDFFNGRRQRVVRKIPRDYHLRNSRSLLLYAGTRKFGRVKSRARGYDPQP